MFLITSETMPVFCFVISVTCHNLPNNRKNDDEDDDDDDDDDDVLMEHCVHLHINANH
jgi:hypothetical protein